MGNLLGIGPLRGKKQTMLDLEGHLAQKGRFVFARALHSKILIKCI
jgi:hypothetical protein